MTALTQTFHSRVVLVLALVAVLVVTGGSAAPGAHAAVARTVTLSGEVLLGDAAVPEAGEIVVRYMTGSTTYPVAAGGLFEFTVETTSASTSHDLTFEYVGPRSYVAQRWGATEMTPGVVSDLSVTLPVGGVISGVVRTAQGQVVDDGEVSLQISGGAQSVELDDEGRYSFRNVPRGSARLLFGQYRIGPVDFARKYWTADPADPTVDFIKVDADVHSDVDITVYGPSSLQVSYDCAECPEGIGTYASLEWRRSDGRWRNISAGHLGSDPLSGYYSSLPPGGYRITTAEGYGRDRTSTPLVVLDGSSSRVTVERDRAALHIRDAAGRLYRYDTNGAGRFAPAVLVGTGYSGFARMIDAADLDSDGERDLLGITAAGVMSLLAGRSDGGFEAPAVVSKGWQNYVHVLPIGDWGSDGNQDLLAVGKSGTVYLFSGDGDGGFGSRVQIGGSGRWAAYPKIAAIWDESPKVVAVSSTGRAYTFSGTDLGHRTLLATNWADVTQVTGVGTFNQDPKADVVIRRSNGTVSLVKMANDATDRISGYLTLATNWSKRLLI